MDFAANTLLTSTIHRVLHAQGFTRSSSTAAGVLTDLLSRYLTILTISASKYATLCGRGRMLDARDLIESLDEMGVSIDDLSDYCAGEGRDFMRLISRRREEDLVEMRSHLIAGLEREEAEPVILEWRELPDDLSEPDVDVGMLDAAEPIPLLMDVDSPALPLHPHPDHIPAFLPPFPIISEPEPEDPDSTLMPPPPVPGASNMPTLPSQTLTSTSTSAQDYFIRNQYELSSLSSTPEWHLPADVIPSSTTTKSLALSRQQKASGANPVPLPVPNMLKAMLEAYHHILTNPSPSDLGPPSHAKHRLLLQFLFPSLSGVTYAGSLTDKWDAPDTIFGTLGFNFPRPPGGIGGSAITSGSMPYPLHSDPTRELVPKGDKGLPDDKVITNFPPLGGRYIGGMGVGNGGDRAVGLVGHKVGIARLSELSRVSLNNQIRSRINKLTHPPPLYRQVRENMFQRLVYGRGNEAPWNSTFFPIPAPREKVKDKSGAGPSTPSAGLGKIKLTLNGTGGDSSSSKKRKKGKKKAGDDEDDDDDEYNSSDSESGQKKKPKLEGGVGGKAEDGKKKFMDARLWLTWEHEVKDFQKPLMGVARTIPPVSAVSSVGPGRGSSLSIVGRKISVSGPKS